MVDKFNPAAQNQGFQFQYMVSNFLIVNYNPQTGTDYDNYDDDDVCCQKI